MMGHIQSVNILLQNIYVDANIVKGIDGGTAFSIASKKSHFDVMRVLLESGKSLESKGWCYDSWTSPCQIVEDDDATKNPESIIPTLGEVY